MEKENTLPLITEDQITLGSKKLDELFDFTKIIKNKIVGAGVEIFDGKAFKITLGALNDFVSKFIPDEFKDEFQVALDDVMDGDNDFTVASDQFFDISTQLISKLEGKVNKSIVSGANAIIETINIYINAKLEELSE